MLTQISFTADKKLKEKALKKAKEKGITLKSVLIFSMESFSEGKINVGLLPSNNDIEELNFDSPSINKKAEKLASLLK
jgi:purine-nucleoside phosphorylase